MFHLLIELATEKNVAFYYVKRGSNSSEIVNFPEKLLEQKAEYSFLFYKIKKYIEHQDEDEYIVGHFLRRFMEIFISYKNPTKGDVKSKLDAIINSDAKYKDNQTLQDAIYKVINNESHTYMTNERLNSGNLLNTANSVLNFISLVDATHYSFLEKNYV